MGFIANFIRFPTVQKFWKSIKIWQSYREFNGGNFFEAQCSCELVFVQNVAKALANGGSTWYAWFTIGLSTATIYPGSSSCIHSFISFICFFVHSDAVSTHSASNVTFQLCRIWWVNKTIIITSLPKVIWEEGHIAAKVSPHWLQWCTPNAPPKVPLSVDRSPNSTTCLIPGPVRPVIQTASVSDLPFSTMHWTDRRTDRQIICGKVWWL